MERTFETPGHVEVASTGTSPGRIDCGTRAEHSLRESEGSPGDRPATPDARRPLLSTLPGPTRSWRRHRDGWASRTPSPGAVSANSAPHAGAWGAGAGPPAAPPDGDAAATSGPRPPAAASNRRRATAATIGSSDIEVGSPADDLRGIPENSLRKCRDDADTSMRTVSGIGPGRGVRPSRRGPGVGRQAGRGHVPRSMSTAAAEHRSLRDRLREPPAGGGTRDSAALISGAVVERAGKPALSGRTACATRRCALRPGPGAHRACWSPDPGPFSTRSHRRACPCACPLRPALRGPAGGGRRDPGALGRPAGLRRLRARTSTGSGYTRSPSPTPCRATTSTWSPWPGSARCSDPPIHDAFPGRILNTHPALLPAFPGWHAVPDAAGGRGEGDRPHRPPRHPGDGRRADPGPGRCRVPRRHGRRCTSASRTVERSLYPDTVAVDAGATPATGDDQPGGAPMRALLSVYDKTGPVRAGPGAGQPRLGADAERQHLRRPWPRRGIDHREVADLTGAPEMLGGRVKTLHPVIHGGILADRSKPEHLADLRAPGHRADRPRGVQPLPLQRRDPSIELIDVGGPTMVRAAAKNHAHVGIVVSPSDYGAVLESPRRPAPCPHETRRRLARAAFAHTAAYDAAIVAWFDTAPGRAAVPPSLHLALERAGSSATARTPTSTAPATAIVGRHSLVGRRGPARRQGALLPQPLRRRRGLAAGPRVGRARPRRAGGRDHQARQPLRGGRRPRPRRGLSRGPWMRRSQSAFGGVVAIGRGDRPRLAEAIAAGPQADVIIARSIDDAARERLVKRRKATRLLTAPPPSGLARQFRVSAPLRWSRRPTGSSSRRSGWTVVTKAQPTEEQWRDLALAWRVCARTMSNSIAIVTGGQAVGIGAGQQSRVGAAEIAVTKAGDKARVGRRRATPSSPSPTGSRSWPRPGSPRWCTPADRSATPRSSRPPTSAGIALVATGERHFRH